MSEHPIVLKNVCEHNLKGINLKLKPHQLVVCTGVSGSGKSSLIFDTIYVEGQRRYVESLSPYVRRQIVDWTKPKLDDASGITPTISIEQKSVSNNPRSTVGTMTEVYDYLRLLFSRVGIPHCPISHEPVLAQSKEKIIAQIQSMESGEKALLLAPFAKEKKGEFKEEFADLKRRGYLKVRVDGTLLNLEEEIFLDGNVAHNVEIVVDRFSLLKENGARIAESITTALRLSSGSLILHFLDSKEEKLYSTHGYAKESGVYYEPLEPQDFSFNTPSGMCPNCSGLGETLEFNEELVIDPAKSISEDCCLVASSINTVRFGNIYRYLGEKFKFSLNTPWKKLSDEAKRIFLYGSDRKWLRIPFVHPETGSTWYDHVKWEGVFAEAKRRYSEAKSDTYKKRMHAFMTKGICSSCQGSRLKPYPSATLLGGKTIQNLVEMTIGELKEFFQELKLTDEEMLIAKELLLEIKSRLEFLDYVGLHYLSLNRSSPTLSGGEGQRVRLASQIGSGLVGITYILDEPSIGLHQSDNEKLIETLKTLRDRGNTVLVVEHDEETILAADHILDVGPGPGYLGGELLVDGSLEDLINCKRSVTGAYLRGEKEIAIPKKRRKKKCGSIEIKGASHHNLKNIDVTIPLGKFVAVTGVSGSGKSSLILDILHPALANQLHQADQIVGKHKSIKGIDQIDKVIAIDQSPIGRTPRSNPATYIKLFDLIRSLFAELPDAKAKGFDVGQFSFNVKEGSCTTCGGQGMIQVDMDFLEDAYVLCPACEGQRFDPHTLSVTFKGKSIADVLNMEVEEALNFFEAIPKIKKCLEVLMKVGLGYIKLGQPSPTLSGGEAQRIKLAKELLRPSTGKTLYLLDEPSTGLHFADIDKLLSVLHHFVEEGNTVLCIEHNLDIIKTADWIIDLGPTGGKGGGQLIGEGTPEDIAKLASPTGRVLKHQLEKKHLGPKTNGALKEAVRIQNISVAGATENNLKSVSAVIPREKITIFCGPSGSGKSSLAFDTIYAEGQRRYTESLSPYIRQFVKQMDKPHVAFIEGLSPAIAIEQKAHSGNPRSTIGTMTEIYDYLRILYTHLGIAHNPKTGNALEAISIEYLFNEISAMKEGAKLQILCPIEIKRTEPFELLLQRLKKEGFLRIVLNDEPYHLDDTPLESIPFDRKKKNQLQVIVDRVVNRIENGGRIYDSLTLAAKLGKKCLVIQTDETSTTYYLQFTDKETGESFPPITPKTFAFNAPQGYCLNCLGIGTQYGSQILSEPSIYNLTVNGLLELIFGFKPDKELLNPLFAKEKINPTQKVSSLNSHQLEILTKGSKEWLPLPSGGEFRFSGIDPILAYLAKNGEKEVKEILEPLMNTHTCASCQGERLNPMARHVTIEGLSLPKLTKLSIEAIYDFIKKLPIEKNGYLEELHDTVLKRLEFLIQIGLNYLSLDRTAPTLSGGETQRIRLARQLGSGLTGTLYVLDEPTIGLHPHDTKRLNKALLDLKKLGNTLILVEHDEETLKIADHLIDFGPAAGTYGGEIMATGTYEELLQNERSLTGQYLSGKKAIPIPLKRRPSSKGELQVFGAKLHNLKSLDVTFPLKSLVAITGPSGSGKSTLVDEILAPFVKEGLENSDQITKPYATLSGIDQLDKLLYISQEPVGHTARSDVGTYCDVVTHIRQLFALLPQAQMKGLQPRNFSYNNLKGMCTHCFGLGYKKVEMLFMPAVQIECPMCKGMRLNPVSQEVKFKGKSMGEILKTTVDEAKELFENQPRIIRILNTLIDVGLGYLQLGQQMQTLSGGEAQRIKLSRELSKRATGKTLYILDEPSVGLHAEDIDKLLKVLHRLVDKGNSVIVVEHQLDVIANADYVIDLGPKAGDEGGEIVATGTPEAIALNKNSLTGSYLKETLRRKPC